MTHDWQQPLGRPMRRRHVVLIAFVVIVILGITVGPWLILTRLSQATYEPDRRAIGEGARSLASSLKSNDVRAAIDNGGSLNEIAELTFTAPQNPALIAAIGKPAAVSTPQRVLLDAAPSGATGASVDVTWGGIAGEGQSSGIFGPRPAPWVVCLRVELPETSFEATEWRVHDIDCPTFAPGIRMQALRVHARELPAGPLSLPPCYGTSGYCPGG